MSIVRAVVKTDDGDTFYMASLDGETFLEVRHPVEAGQEKELYDLMHGLNPDGSMKGMIPIRIHRRYFQLHDRWETTYETVGEHHPLNDLDD